MSDFGVITAILNIIDIPRRWCKLNFGPMWDQVKSCYFPERIGERKQYFSFLYNFFGIIGRKRLGKSFPILIWINYYLLNGIRLDLDNSCWIRKTTNFATNNITTWFLKHQTQYGLGKSNLLNLIVLLTAKQIIEVSFHAFLRTSLVAYNKINLSSAS